MYREQFPQWPGREMRLLAFQLASPDDSLRTPEPEKADAEGKEGKEKQELTEKNLPMELRKRMERADGDAMKIQKRMEDADRKALQLREESNKNSDMLTEAGGAMVTGGVGVLGAEELYRTETVATDHTAAQEKAELRQEAMTKEEKRESVLAKEGPDKKGEKAA